MELRRRGRCDRRTIDMSHDPRFDINDDGTAKNPIAFRQALREDAEKLKLIEVGNICIVHREIVVRAYVHTG
eukprot:5266373-Pyramimonas_sp.AAC.1